MEYECPKMLNVNICGVLQAYPCNMFFSVRANNFSKYVLNAVRLNILVMLNMSFKKSKISLKTNLSTYEVSST